MELFKPKRKRKKIKPALGQPSAQRHGGPARAAGRKAEWAGSRGPASAQVVWPERSEERAPPVVTTRWPRVRRRGGAAGADGAGAQPRRGVAVVNQR
jgi:hypothetical protein